MKLLPPKEIQRMEGRDWESTCRCLSLEGVCCQTWTTNKEKPNRKVGTVIIIILITDTQMNNLISYPGKQAQRIW